MIASGSGAGRLADMCSSVRHVSRAGISGEFLGTASPQGTAGRDGTQPDATALTWETETRIV